MIITGVVAENLLKYSRLELRDLPEQGVIAISGRNESGKSSIGEILCFALFGRTFALEPGEVSKAIRWGEENGSVTLDFRGRDNREYTLHRFLERGGRHGARLHAAGSDETLAGGAEAVTDRVRRLIGYGYEEFIESFYLAQREITTPHAHSDAVKRMAGLSDLEAATGEFHQEIEREESLLEACQEHAAALEQQLAELEIRVERLPELEEERAEAGAAVAEMERQLAEMKRAVARYCEQAPRMPQFETSERRSRWSAAVLLLLSALFAAWGLGAGSSLLLSLSAFCGLPALPAVGLTLFFRQRIASVHREAQGLCAQITTAHRFAHGWHREPEDLGVDTAELPEEYFARSNRSGLSESELDAFCRQLASLQVEPHAAETTLGRELEWMAEGLNSCQGRVAELKEAITEEMGRLQQAADLRRQREEQETHAGAHRRRMESRERALELLVGAARSLSQRFNRDLQDLAARTLPLFTEGRYEHLRIDQELRVSAFSGEKRDFIDLEEISSGTQRQIMLAVRLALSQELVNRAATGRQFIFLDEPFAFFDQERTANALRVFPDLSDELTQCWIVAQQFPPDQRFALAIGCDRDQEELVGSGKGKR
jgi:exonuclease SbcC